MSVTRSITGIPETLPIRLGFVHLRTPGFSPRQSQVSLQLALVSDVRRQGATVSSLTTLVPRLANLLQMNDLELAAWDCLLMKEFKSSDSPSQQVTTLKMTSYQSKSLLCRDMDFIHDQILAEDQNFSADYEAWIASHRRSESLSLEEIHRQYKKMVACINTLQKSESLNDAVDCIVQTQVETVEAPPGISEEEQFRKIRKVSFSSSDGDFYETPCVSYGQCADYPEFQETFEDVEQILCHLTHYV